MKVAIISPIPHLSYTRMGTMHMALGMGIAESGSLAKSAIHWDILKDMKSEDSRIVADGKVIYQAGKWLI